MLPLTNYIYIYNHTGMGLSRWESSEHEFDKAEFIKDKLLD